MLLQHAAELTGLRPATHAQRCTYIHARRPDAAPSAVAGWDRAAFCDSSYRHACMHQGLLTAAACRGRCSSRIIRRVLAHTHSRTRACTPSEPLHGLTHAPTFSSRTIHAHARHAALISTWRMDRASPMSCCPLEPISVTMHRTATGGEHSTTHAHATTAHTAA